MARLDTTVSDQQNEAVTQMAEEFGLSKSEVLSEAVSVLMQVVVEAKRGRRLMMVDEFRQQPPVMITTRVLTSVDWMRQTQRVEVSSEALEAVQGIIDSPSEPTAALREAIALRRPRQ
jgi:hypothetical protein